jgi:hypothetical protein
MTNKKTDVFQHIDMSGGQDACWPWKSAVAGNKRPYFTIEGRKVLAYRLVKELVTGTSLHGVGRHTCDNPICCNPRHIVEGTHQQNMDDMKGRERHGLPHHVVKSIRRLLNAGRTQQEIADLYGTSRETISAIATNRVYQHVKEDDSNDETDPRG